MRLFRFDPAVAHPITQYDSHGVSIGRGARYSGDVQIGFFHIQAGGVVGYHPASAPQLFMVVTGEGWVRGEDEARMPIRPGQAAFWVAGEHHESGSDTGMAAVVIEGNGLDPSRYMPELLPDD
jgi:hypothetical protein